jgi:heme oxygenase
MTDHDANLVARLHRAEHFLRHAVEGEYHANSVMKAIFAYEDQSEALAKADDANLVASTITRQATQIATLTQILHNIHALARYDPSSQTFEEAWATKGYIYGQDALDNVRLGWDMAILTNQLTR